MSDMEFPRVEPLLPGLMDFAAELARNLESGEIDSGPAMAASVRAFFSEEKRAEVDAVMPGWREMASYAEDATLVHVMAVLAALLLCPEYCAAAEARQVLLQWIVLLHDIDKKVVAGQRDPTHPFRCAAKAGPILAGLGFWVTERYEAGVESWSQLAMSAETTEGDSSTPDNGKLAEIVAGIGEIFGRGTATALAVEAILLHQSVNVVEKWPQAAPLTDEQVRQYISPQLCPLLKIMMLVDNDAWNLFDPVLRDLFRRETLQVFGAIEGGL